MISDFAEDYLVDHKDGIRKLTAWLLNEVPQREALDQIQAQPYERTGKRRRAVMVRESDLLKPFTAM